VLRRPHQAALERQVRDGQELRLLRWPARHVDRRRLPRRIHLRWKTHNLRLERCDWGASHAQLGPAHVLIGCPRLQVRTRRPTQGCTIARAARRKRRHSLLRLMGRRQRLRRWCEHTLVAPPLLGTARPPSLASTTPPGAPFCLCVFGQEVPFKQPQICAGLPRPVERWTRLMCMCGAVPLWFWGGGLAGDQDHRRHPARHGHRGQALAGREPHPGIPPPHLR
jgi:hypothetical protein